LPNGAPGVCSRGELWRVRRIDARGDSCAEIRPHGSCGARAWFAACGCDRAVGERWSRADAGCAGAFAPLADGAARVQPGAHAGCRGFTHPQEESSGVEAGTVFELAGPAAIYGESSGVDSPPAPPEFARRFFCLRFRSSARTARAAGGRHLYDRRHGTGVQPDFNRGGSSFGARSDAGAGAAACPFDHSRRQKVCQAFATGWRRDRCGSVQSYNRSITITTWEYAQRQAMQGRQPIHNSYEGKRCRWEKP
jgi:hypothetical protein